MLKDHVECGINPSLTSENEETVTPATISQNILVIGGGPAGLEAAYILSKRGHKVTLAERHHTLGGAMIVAGYPIAKQHFAQTTKYFIKRVIDCNVKIELNTIVDQAYLSQHHYDHIIVATGAKPLRLDIFKIILILVPDKMCFLAKCGQVKILSLLEEALLAVKLLILLPH